MQRAFLERERETEALRDCLDDVARSRAGVLVLVAGEAGLGKTTLVRRVCSEAAGRRQLWGVMTRW